MLITIKSRSQLGDALTGSPEFIVSLWLLQGCTCDRQLLNLLPMVGAQASQINFGGMHFCKAHLRMPAEVDLSLRASIENRVHWIHH